jgi:phosphoribosylformylglycinamidine synthase
MAVAGGCGFDVALTSELVPALAWFSESASRVVVAVDPAAADALVDRARSAAVPAQRLGTAGGDRLVAAGAFDVPLGDATHAWRDALPSALHADPRASRS